MSAHTISTAVKDQVCVFFHILHCHEQVGLLKNNLPKNVQCPHKKSHWRSGLCFSHWRWVYLCSAPNFTQSRTCCVENRKKPTSSLVCTAQKSDKSSGGKLILSFREIILLCFCVLGVEMFTTTYVGRLHVERSVRSVSQTATRHNARTNLHDPCRRQTLNLTTKQFDKTLILKFPVHWTFLWETPLPRVRTPGTIVDKVELFASNWEQKCRSINFHESLLKTRINISSPSFEGALNGVIQCRADNLHPFILVPLVRIPPQTNDTLDAISNAQ